MCADDVVLIEGLFVCVCRCRYMLLKAGRFLGVWQMLIERLFPSGNADRMTFFVCADADRSTFLCADADRRTFLCVKMLIEGHPFVCR